jgi:ribonuclease HIII
MPAKPLLSYTRAVTGDQASRLRQVLERDNFDFVPKEHTYYAATNGKVNVAVYKKGPKVLVQGKGTSDFVTYTLEPEILGSAELGYEEVLKPDMYEPHFGIDESGKGDFFGPLVIAGVYTDREIARQLREAGVMDSKRITTDEGIRALADAIRSIPRAHHYVLSLGPEKYNEFYPKFRSLNYMLAWAHAEVIAVLKRYVPECPRALSDQFADAAVLTRAVKAKKLGDFQLDQRTKGESDPAVAAASILARERFINWMDECSRRLGFKLPRGATSVKKQAARFIEERGAEALPKVAKMHFKTANEVLGLPVVERKWIPRKPRA